jgi:hypothetical protein
MKSTRFWLAAAAVFIAAAFRLLPHPPGFSPIAAMALFGGAYLSSRKAAILIPFAAMLLSDWAIGFHTTMPAVYGAFALTSLLGAVALRGRPSWRRVAGTSLLASVAFFVVTNFAVWLGGGYPATGQGLLACYVAAIPFFNNGLLGDLVFSGLLFGAWRFFEWRVPAMAVAPKMAFERVARPKNEPAR